MTDLQTLHDAFTELERRADAVVPAARPQPHRARGFRLVPIVATMAAVAALAAGAMWVAPGDTSAPSAGTAVANFPSTPEELTAKLKAVVGDMATVEVTDSLVDTDKPGMTITGMMTAGGVTGGFDLRVYLGDEWPQCGPEECLVRGYPIDSRKATFMTTGLPGPGGFEHVATFTHPDGFNMQLRVSNERSPNGNSEVLAPKPPLTAEQTGSILESW
jgi:hypothetical protein